MQLANDYRNRWALIPFLSQETLEELHAREQSFSNNWPMVFAGHYRNSLLARHDLNPFWKGDMAEELKKDRLENFLRETYFIWGKELTTWQEAIVKETPGSAHAEAEISVIHRIEKRIWETGNRVDRAAPGWKNKESKRGELHSKFQQAMQD